MRRGVVALLVAGANAAPNFLFIVVDDLGNYIEQYAGFAKTPNVARLAEAGSQFDHAHISVPICGPSRTAFLTGMRPDTTQVWTIGPYFRNVAKGQGMEVVTLPQLFRQSGYNVTGAGKIYHPGTPSGGLIKSEGGGDQCPNQSKLNECAHRPALDEPASWTEPYHFCDQYANDTVQSPAMQSWACSLHGEARRDGAVATWPSCGGGCVQTDECVACFKSCGTWGKAGAYAACDCPDACYPEGVIAEQTIRVLRDKAEHPTGAPWFHAVGFKRPHLSYRAPRRFFDMYDVKSIPLPLHRTPSPTAPAISYAHTCIANADPASHEDDPYGMAAAVFLNSAAAAGACTPSVMQRTSAFNGTYDSYIEIIKDDTIVRELRRAYYATISFTDAALGRVLDELQRLKLDSNTAITFIGDHGYQNGQKGEVRAEELPSRTCAPLGQGACLSQIDASACAPAR